jgi:hypothetical protein
MSASSARRWLLFPRQKNNQALELKHPIPIFESR